MPLYNKLIRDRIPEIIEKDNKEYEIRELSDDEFKKELLNKIYEEYQELSEAGTTSDSLEELADILELIHTAAKMYGSDFDNIEKIRREKKKKRGGFAKQLFLISVQD